MKTPGGLFQEEKFYSNLNLESYQVENGLATAPYQQDVTAEDAQHHVRAEDVIAEDALQDVTAEDATPL